MHGFRPLVSYDSITGQPQIKIAYQIEAQKLQTLKAILQFLNVQDKPIINAVKLETTAESFVRKGFDFRTNFIKRNNL